MPLYNFQKRFAAPVESGSKRQTIRRRRKRPTQPGEKLFLYTGLRSKYARKLREAICTNVHPIEIHSGAVKIGPDWIPVSELEAFAHNDGFEDSADFFKFWREIHGLTEQNPLTGFDLIQW